MVAPVLDEKFAVMTFAPVDGMTAHQREVEITPSPVVVPICVQVLPRLSVGALCVEPGPAPTRMTTRFPAVTFDGKALPPEPVESDVIPDDSDTPSAT